MSDDIDNCGGGADSAGKAATESPVAVLDASAESATTSTPPPAPNGKAADLQALLQQRAKSAIEGAKQRNVVRDNYRMSADYVHRVIRNVVIKLNWVEDERRERDKLRKKAQTVQPERPARRRERKREFRSRGQSNEYEEVPGGGQFLMMLLGKNEQKPGGAEGGNKAVEDTAEGRRKPKGKGTSQGEDINDDPCILHAEVSTSRRVPGPPPPPPPLPGGQGAPRVVPPPPRIVQPPGAVASAYPARPSAGGAAAAADKAALVAAAEAAWDRAEDLMDAPNGLPQSEVSEQINLKSLLSVAGIADTTVDEDKPPPPREKEQRQKPAVVAKEAKASAPQLSKASSKIFGALQSMMLPPQEETKQPSPYIAPMPEFASIWGSTPKSGPSSDPKNSNWPAGQAGAADPWSQGGPDSDPWALPASALGDNGTLASCGSRPPPAREAEVSTSGPSPAGGTSSSKSRRDRRHRDRRAKKEEESAKEEDLWDMPSRGALNHRGPSEDCELPEFFRDSNAPAFVGHMLEADAPRQDDDVNPEGMLGDLLDDDDEDDEICFKGSLLG
eukprot:gnl/TRDRNA2_/TRDRNA2_164126_c0_seq1.p1 gnl/TRDRNA2_/TRDRNA2_164126_c0~~gnl/TRDRNA2_/TRDRNA2_164126_c0_seq1.p1  ORF type:complete len:558 (+),score=143.78 gnl/TRDRNA2_/TRDRNA2_164126_c0_seq1:2-1675(+)